MCLEWIKRDAELLSESCLYPICSVYVVEQVAQKWRKSSAL